ncbi:MAG: glycosyltransferase family 4 protein [Anaerolineae bacterium]
MRVLMVSKACIVGAYQTKLEALAALPAVELFVIVPPYWKGPEGTTVLEPRHTAGYQLIVSPMRWNGHFHIHYYPALSHWVRQLRPDILHMDEEPYNLATYLGLCAGRAAGARSLFFTWQNLLRTYPPPFRWFEQASFRLADYAIAGSADAAEVLRRKGYAGPVAVIPQFGVDPEQFRPPAAREGQGQPLRVGYAGRLVPEKGVHVLLEALAGLSVPWRASIVGEGPERPALEELARRLGIAERVEFAGRLRSADMPSWYAGIDALVLPSLRRPNWMEQFGRVLIEAMAMETVVVGSDCGEIPRVIGDAGLVFPEGDVHALRAHLEWLAARPEERLRLGRAGRQRVLAHFTQEHIAAQTYGVYQTMMAPSRAAGGGL